MSAIALGYAWLALLLLVALTVHGVLARRFPVLGSAAPEDFGAGLFFALAMLSFGVTYLRDGHVRVDLLRERMSARRRAWLEVLGCVSIVLPVCGYLVQYGADVAWLAWRQGAPGLALVKAAVPAGFVLLALAAGAVAVHNAIFLSGTTATPAPQAEG